MIFKQISNMVKASAKAENTSNVLRQNGDRYRDKKEWSQAVESYRAYLAINPGDFDIIVQLGNSLKESGAHEDAINMYDQAIRINPQDSDVFLQKGHAHKLMGRMDEAANSYMQSYERKFDQPHALRELIALNRHDLIGTEIKNTIVDEVIPKTIWLDITDLTDYLKSNNTLSGIQRLVANIITHSHLVENNSEYRIAFTIPDYEKSKIYEVSRKIILSLISLIETNNFEKNLIDELLVAVHRSRQDVQPSVGDAIVIPGAFWIASHYDLIKVMRARGVLFGVFIHDLIPINYPQYVHPSATKDFRRALVDVLTLSNFVLTNSQYVADSVADFLRDRLNFLIPIKSVPLATQIGAHAVSRQKVSPEILEITRKRFVLCVCTIEVRKNHAYLVTLWNRLRAEFQENIPNLIFVGKWGWDVETFRNNLMEGDALDNWLFILNGVSDVSLSYLYHNCLFTMYVSFAEGWGLPVGESLAHGKPCVASGTTSIPEVGGALVRYIDPFDIDSGYAVVKELIGDNAMLEEWAQKIRNEFKARTWDEFCADFFSFIFERQISRDDLQNATNCKLPAGDLVFAGTDYLDSADLGIQQRKMLTFRMACKSGWHEIEGWGVWGSRRRSQLLFQTDLPANEEIKFFLRVVSPQIDGRLSLLIQCGGIDTLVENCGDVAEFVQGNGMTSAQGLVEINLISMGSFVSSDTRGLNIGLTCIAYCQTSDVFSRLSLLEKVVMYR